MTKPRILLIAPECPWPADMGLKTHLLQVIRAWAGAAELTVYGFYFTADEERRWRQLAAREAFQLGGLARVRQGWQLRIPQLRCLLTARPLAEARYRMAGAAEAVQALVDAAHAQGRPYDWVAHEVFHTLMPLRLPAPARRLLFPVDCYTLYYGRMHAQASSLAEWLRTGYLRWVCRRMERRYDGIDLIVTVAEPDAAALRALLPGARVEVVPVAVEAAPVAVEAAKAAVRANPRRPQRRSGPRRVLVAGYFGIPTVARDTRLFLEAWAALPDRPPVELMVWGRHGSRAGLEPACRAAGAELVEWVDDYDEFLASGDVYVYPQRFACGVQTKVQQAMGAGLAVLAVSDVLDALGARQGQEGCRVTDPAGCAAELAALLGDPDRIARLGAGAARAMERAFAPALVYGRLRELIGIGPAAAGRAQDDEAEDDAILHCGGPGAGEQWR